MYYPSGYTPEEDAQAEREYWNAEHRADEAERLGVVTFVQPPPACQRGWDYAVVKGDMLVCQGHSDAVERNEAEWEALGHAARALRTKAA